MRKVYQQHEVCKMACADQRSYLQHVVADHGLKYVFIEVEHRQKCEEIPRLHLGTLGIHLHGCEVRVCSLKHPDCRGKGYDLYEVATGVQRELWHVQHLHN